MATGRAWLIGIGEQRIVVRDGRFEYRGGRLPSPLRVDEAPLRAAVESIPGLRGFVGVDFIWDEGRRRATMLEINPRPTTSIVGLTSILPPGRLAAAWIGAFDPDCPGADLLAGLADLVRSHHVRCPSTRPVRSAPTGGRRMSRPSGRVDRPAGSAWTSVGPTSRSRTSRAPRSTVPFEVWKRPDELGRAIAAVAATLPPSSSAAVTMTAELCDCYPTKDGGRQRRPRRGARGLARAARSSSGALTASFTRVAEIAASGRCSPRRPTGWRWRRWRPGWFPTTRRS